MNRKERRRRAREKKKLEEKLRREAPQSHIAHAESQQPQSQGGQYFRKTVSRTKVLWGLVLGAITLLGGYALFHPHVSVEPGLLLNPLDPYSTQFTVTNNNEIFDIRTVNCVCWPRKMDSGNGFSVVSPGYLPNVHHLIPLLQSGAQSTVDCPSIIGGIGAWSGQVINAELEIDVSYNQDWWPRIQRERYAFKAVTASDKSVHWIPITPGEETPLFPK